MKKRTVKKIAHRFLEDKTYLPFGTYEEEFQAHNDGSPAVIKTIASPSKVFAGIGENMALGVGEGWDSAYGAIRWVKSGKYRMEKAGGKKMSEGWLFRELPVDVYCTFDWEQQHLFISFLPPDYIYKLPEKDRDEFDRIYCEFASWVSDELGLYDYVGSKLDSPVSDALFDEIRGEIKRRIDAYEKTHPPLSMTFRELLLKK